MHRSAIVPNNPLRIRSFLFIPQGFIFFFLIISEVIIRLNKDLKKTNSYMLIAESIFLTQTVIKLKKNDAKTRYNLNLKFRFSIFLLIDCIYKIVICEFK